MEIGIDIGIVLFLFLAASVQFYGLVISLA